MTVGVYKFNGCRCEGDDLICCINPELSPTFVDSSGKVHDFFNRSCSLFKKVSD